MTDWEQFLAYKCDSCTEDCINRRDSPPAESELCWRCYNLAVDAGEISPPEARDERRAASAARSDRNAAPLQRGADPEARPSDDHTRARESRPRDRERRRWRVSASSCEIFSVDGDE